MSHLLNRARVIAGVVASLGACGTALAGGGPAVFTTLNSGWGNFSYSGVNTLTGVAETGTETVTFTGPSNLENVLLNEPFGTGLNGGVAGWSVFGSGNTDTILMGSFWSNSNFAVMAYDGLFVANFTLTSATGAAVISNIFPPAGYPGVFVELKDATSGALMNTDVGTILTNGNYVLTTLGSFVAKGTPEANMGNGSFGAAIDFQPASVPAPGAIALLGLAGLAGRRRR